MKDKDYIKLIDSINDKLQDEIGELEEENNWIKKENERLKYDNAFLINMYGMNSLKMRDENKKLKQENKKLKEEIKKKDKSKMGGLWNSIKCITLNDYNKLKEKQRKAGLRIKGLKEELEKEKNKKWVTAETSNFFSGLVGGYSIPNDEKERMLFYASVLKRYCKRFSCNCKGCCFENTKSKYRCALTKANHFCPEHWKV